MKDFCDSGWEPLTHISRIGGSDGRRCHLIWQDPSHWAVSHQPRCQSACSSLLVLAAGGLVLGLLTVCSHVNVTTGHSEITSTQVDYSDLFLWKCVPLCCVTFLCGLLKCFGATGSFQDINYVLHSWLFTADDEFVPTWFIWLLAYCIILNNVCALQRVEAFLLQSSLPFSNPTA